MSLTLTSSRGTSRSPSRGVRIGAALLAVVVAFGVTRIITTKGGDQATSDDATSDDATSAQARVTDPALEIAKLEQRIAADPDDADAWQRLAPYYLARASGSGDRALVFQAEHAVDEAIRLRPDDIATYRAHGALELTLHQFAAAREVGLAAHGSHPDSPDALAILVDSSIELGRYDEADSYLRELLDRRPNAAALARVSYLREIHGDLPGARVAMSQAETAASGNASESATITTLVGDLALAAGEPTEALAAYERAAAQQPERSLTELGMARALAALDRTDEAIDILETSIARFPEPALLTLLGELYEATGRVDEASQIYAQTAALIDRHGASGEDNSLEAARFHADHADPDDAVRFARTAFHNRPTVFAADVLAWSLTRAGQAEEALPYVEMANRLGTNSVDMHVHSAAAYAATGHTTDARDALTKAFAGVPHPFPELRPIAIELAAQLDIAVPAAWANR
jgi:tetratricopeptide (TPR) repeat protein